MLKIVKVTVWTTFGERMIKEFIEEYLEHRDGSLWWKKGRSHCKVGKRFGTYNNGYRQGSILGKIYREHHLVWFKYHNKFPVFLDHINGIRDDNRIENLREATDRTNAFNRPKYCVNQSGYKGVSWHKASNSWVAQIQTDNKKIHIGCFNSKEEAYKAYDVKAKELHKEFARTND